MVRNFPIPKNNKENKKYIDKIITIVENLLLNDVDQSLVDQIDDIIFKICKFDSDQINKINLTIINFLNLHDKHTKSL